MDATEKALVLKVGCFREADCWVRLFTPTRGIFNAFAFGGSRSRRRFVGCLDPLSLVLFSIGSDRRGAYSVLGEGSLLHNFPGIRADAAAAGLAANCIRFVEAVEIDPSDAAPVYHLLLKTLYLLDSGLGRPDFVPWFFRARLAFALGYDPDFVNCGTCGRPLGQEQGHLFGVEQGQVVCPACLSAGKPLDGLARPVSPGVLRALKWIRESDPGEWGRVVLDREVRRQVSQLVEMFVAYHLGLSWENGMYKKV